MTEANPSPGADLHTAADRIGGILDPKPQKEPDSTPEPVEAKEVTETEVETEFGAGE